MTDARRQRYQRLSGFLRNRTDGELVELVGTGLSVGVGVGGESSVVEVDGVAVFVKRIPLTERELEHRGSTANHFEVPLFCQYGIGGPGFNGWRELAANEVATEAVLGGEARLFPVLYHWRVLPGRSAVAAEHADIDVVVAAQGESAAVRARLEALVVAPGSLVLFSEYIPYAVGDWLRENPVGKAVVVERQLVEIVAFLRGRELLHMDGHFGNIRSDGECIYLTDFGLATSPHFDLSLVEHEFVERHVTYDADYTATRLVNWIVTDICGVPTRPTGGPVARNEYVVECAAGRIPDGVPPAVAAILTRHAPAAAMMNAFMWDLFAGEIHTEYPGGNVAGGAGREGNLAVRDVGRGYGGIGA
ncbi:serine/threonine protein phosphatase [Nocardia concava]|uniref:serine/threonine protein phosphatase n=1 Tax=Nocardia concava TaxID=257281 RepID=UPI001C3F410A|nr:serine/threonine protein phosphatase [Nocardia concava]